MGVSRSAVGLNDRPNPSPTSSPQVLRLRGGGKKRKKKVYTKPKKIKHKHKSVKLATLKFYKVRRASSLCVVCVFGGPCVHVCS